MTTKHVVRVKICGIKNVETALAVVGSGADAIGFVFAPSRRRVTPDEAREITRRLPPFIARVGVFVNTTPGQIKQIVEHCGLTAVQLSGDEPPGFTLDVNVPVIRALRVGNGKPIPPLDQYSCDAFLFDTYREGRYGGTGSTFDWSLLSKKNVTRPVILAGGLCADNVCEAVRSVKPYAVDVSGGVETNGRKDESKIIEFITLAKGVHI